MRKYNDQNQLIGMQCNCCQKELKVEQGIVKEGSFSVDYTWGYFSTKDGTHHQFDLCENCYDRFVKELSIPITESENNELL